MWFMGLFQHISTKLSNISMTTLQILDTLPILPMLKDQSRQFTQRNHWKTPTNLEAPKMGNIILPWSSPSSVVPCQSLSLYPLVNRTWQRKINNSYIYIYIYMYHMYISIWWIYVINIFMYTYDVNIYIYMNIYIYIYDMYIYI